MIKKSLTSDGIVRRSLHSSFITMLSASIMWPRKWASKSILTYYWKSVFEEEEVEFNENTIDKIRMALLIKGGVKNPILKDTKQIKKIKQSIKFEEEE